MALFKTFYSYQGKVSGPIFFKGLKDKINIYYRFREHYLSHSELKVSKMS